MSLPTTRGSGAAVTQKVLPTVSPPQHPQWGAGGSSGEGSAATPSSLHGRSALSLPTTRDSGAAVSLRSARPPRGANACPKRPWPQPVEGHPAAWPKTGSPSRRPHPGSHSNCIRLATLLLRDQGGLPAPRRSAGTPRVPPSEPGNLGPTLPPQPSQAGKGPQHQRAARASFQVPQSDLRGQGLTSWMDPRITRQ